MVRRRAVEHAKQPSFATLLKRYRGARRLTQELLAERAGLSREAVSALERGERQYPRADTLNLLVRALGLSDSEHAELWKAARPPVRPRADISDSSAASARPIPPHYASSTNSAAGSRQRTRARMRHVEPRRGTPAHPHWSRRSRQNPTCARGRRNVP